MDDAIVKEKLTAGSIKPEEADTLLKGVKVDTFQMKKDGSKVKSNAIASFYKGYVMAFLLSITTIVYGLNVARSIIQEKTSRIFEVMLSVAKPTDLLAGKLFDRFNGIPARNDQEFHAFVHRPLENSGFDESGQARYMGECFGLQVSDVILRFFEFGNPLPMSFYHDLVFELQK